MLYSPTYGESSWRNGRAVHPKPLPCSSSASWCSSSRAFCHNGYKKNTTDISLFKKILLEEFFLRSIFWGKFFWEVREKLREVIAPSSRSGSLGTNASFAYEPCLSVALGSLAFTWNWNSTSETCWQKRFTTSSLPTWPTAMDEPKRLRRLQDATNLAET